MTSNRTAAYLMLLAVAAIWGFAVPIIKVTLQDFPPVLFLTYRFLLTCLILIPLFFLLEKPKPLKSAKELSLVLLSGLLGSSINLGLLFWGLENTTSLSASLLSSLAPLMVVITAVFVLHEHVTKQEKIGITFALLGTIAFIASSSIIATDTQRTLFGDLIILIANLALVAYVLITKRLLQNNFSAFYLTTSMFLIGFITMLPLAIIFHGPPSHLINYTLNQNLLSHAGVWYMAIFSGGLAYFLYQQAQKKIEAGEAIIFHYLVPFFTAPLALIWLKEAINQPMVISMIVIGCGVFIAQFRKRARPKIVN